MVTRWTDVQGTPNITMQIEVKTIRRMPVAPGSRTMIDVQLINTPGYGSIAHSLDDSYKMIDDELERRMQEVARVDARPHVHRLMEADLIMMRKIQDRCPLIPVIAKADTMTIQEAEKFKDTVRRELKVRNITNIDMNLMHDLSERHGVEYREPFAIVAGQSLDSSGLAQRCYDWGCAKPQTPTTRGTRSSGCYAS